LSILLDSIDEPLHQVSYFVQLPVKITRMLAVHLGRNYRLGLFGFDRLDPHIAVAGFVRNNGSGRVTVQERFGLRNIRLLAGSQSKFHGQTQTTDGHVDLRGKTASVSAQRFFFWSSLVAPFFVPEARWWARMTVLSSSSQYRSGSWSFR
jgi:hypothetical protein